MRNLIASEYLSLDGIMQDPGGVGEVEHGGWTAPYWSDELANFKHDELFAIDGLLLGRIIYVGFAAAWPDVSHEEGEYADWMNGFPKYVLSSSLSNLAWNNSHLLSGDLEGEVRELKQQPGEDLLILGRPAANPPPSWGWRANAPGMGCPRPPLAAVAAQHRSVPNVADPLRHLAVGSAAAMSTEVFGRGSR